MHLIVSLCLQVRTFLLRDMSDTYWTPDSGPHMLKHTYMLICTYAPQNQDAPTGMAVGLHANWLAPSNQIHCSSRLIGTQS
jgi:hypothetical protein